MRRAIRRAGEELGVVKPEVDIWEYLNPLDTDKHLSRQVNEWPHARFMKLLKSKGTEDVSVESGSSEFTVVLTGALEDGRRARVRYDVDGERRANWSRDEKRQLVAVLRDAYRTRSEQERQEARKAAKVLGIPF